MVRKKTLPGSLVLCLLLAAGSLPAQLRTVELGKDSLWKDMGSFDGVAMVAGKWGLKDLALLMSEYAADSGTEFLFHFDSPGEADAAGGYRFAGAGPAISTAVSELGAGSAVFPGGDGGRPFSRPGGSLFSPGSVWGDFTIEFWMYPSLLSRGETVFSWQGAQKDAAGLAAQGMSAELRNRMLTWDFRNFFILPDGRPLSFTLSGTRKLLPRVWHHHLLRFDSTIGLLEYAIDGVPEAAIHLTDTGKEGGSVAVPRLSAGFPGELVLAGDYTGFLDELRMSRRFVQSPSIQKFSGSSGSVVSRIIDLKFASTRVARIDSVYLTPSDSGVAFSYKISDSWTNPRSLEGTDWVPFLPGTDFGEKVRGRYLQLMVELFPDGARDVSPRVSSLTVAYQPNLPPTPPAAVRAAPGNGKVTLTWRKVNDLDVKGYRVYYGDAPHTFLGTGSGLGDSPIDVGDTTRAEISNLENGKLYYFTVVSYDDSEPPQQSAFASEVSARPSRIYP